MRSESATPALTWGADGIIGQQLFKYLWQSSVESRNALDDIDRDRCCSLWADEAQYFTNERDEAFSPAGARAPASFT